MSTAENPATLSEETVAAIRAELEQYPDTRAACVEALKIVQAQHGWVSDEALGELARILGLSVDELEGIATFYNHVYRRPVGRHVILACDSVSCWIMGCDAVSGALAGRLGAGFGQTTADGRFTLLPVPCLGACDRAPVLQIDGTLHTDVNPATLEEVLGAYP